MIKKLMSLLFEEEEVIEEFEEEPTAPVRKAPQPGRTVVKTETAAVPLPQEAKAVYIEKKEQVKEPAPIKKEPESKLRKMTVAQEKPVKVKKTVRAEVKEDYEFTPVISPIFGVMGEKNQPAAAASPVKKASPAKSMLGTVISPIYGMEKPEEDKVEEITERLDKPESAVMKEEPAISVSLDELLTDNEITPADDADLEKTVVASQNLSLFDDEMN